ncbi:MAG: fasciclin domain-containing protein [Deinococcus sp.]|nr:fasciclin domain-containing protein [Deinococcus sp.]
MKKALTLTTLLFTGAAVAGGGSSVPASNSIAGIVANDPNFSTLLTAVQAAGLTEELNSGGPYTVFVPTNAAFAKVPKAQLNALLNDREQLRSVLLYHVVPGSVTSKQVVTLDSATTANGASVNIMTKGGKVMVDGATVTKADVRASNGVVHVVDTVLMP